MIAGSQQPPAPMRASVIRPAPIKIFDGIKEKKKEEIKVVEAEAEPIEGDHAQEATLEQAVADDTVVVEKEESTVPVEEEPKSKWEKILRKERQEAEKRRLEEE